MRIKMLYLYWTNLVGVFLLDPCGPTLKKEVFLATVWLKCSKAISGRVWDGWKSLNAPLL